MFTINTYIEIQIIGLFFLVALSPILIAFVPSLRTKHGLFPGFDSISDKPVKAGLLLIIAFSIGIAANRLLDDYLDEIGLDPGGEYKENFKCDWANSGGLKIKEYNLAEIVVRERSDVVNNLLERHKLFDRILRGAMVSSFLFLFSMFVYWLRLKLNNPPIPRYFLRHYIVAAVLFIIFLLAYWSESSHYKKRVYDLYNQVPANIESKVSLDQDTKDH